MKARTTNTENMHELSFAQLWKQASKQQKDDLTTQLDMGKSHLSSLANGSTTPSDHYKRSMAYTLNSTVEILFPSGVSAQRKVIHSVHIAKESAL